MLHFQNILFDLDGTITKSELGITRSVQKGLEAVGIIEHDVEKLKCFIGPPLYDSFVQHYGLSEEEYVLALDAFHERYRSIGIFECELYEGIEELLQTLLAQGKRLFVATSKPEREAKRVIEHFGLNRYFEFVGGSDGDHNCERPTKADVIRYVLRSCDLDYRDCVMIGDKSHDVLGAKVNAIPTIGVLYGYGSRQELMDCEAMALCASVREVQELF